MTTQAADALTSAPELRPNKGFHPFLDTDHEYLFVDACMQAWRDADFANAHRHGVSAYAVTAIMPHSSVARALEDVMFYHLIARQHENVFVAESAVDIRRAKRDGKAAFIIAAQDGDWIGYELHRLEAFYRLGLRMMLPVYNKTNLIGGGCLDTNTGLTRLGEAVVDECNRLGLLLDGSHVARRTTLEMMARSNQPFVFSHSNANALVDNPRNVDDEQIRACTANGGVIGLVAFGPFVLKAGQTEWPSLDDLLEHADYIAQLTGSSRHIGIGTDMSLGSYPYDQQSPWGSPAYQSSFAHYNFISSDSRSPKRALRDFNCYPQIVDVADKLLGRGFTHEDVHGILGGNFLRVFEQVWK
jgi:membrane dipeptidase